MSGFDEAYNSIRRELAATPTKRVLLVEGTGDVDFLTLMLDKPPLREQNIHARWVIGAVGGKDSVLRMLGLQPRWLGLVDRDAWSEAEIADATARVPNLRLLPRYCIENYLIDPMTFQVFEQRAQSAKAKQAVRDAAQYCKARWGEGIRHGSLWRAVQPLQDALQDRGFNGTLLRFDLPDDSQVRATLRSWSELLDEQRVYGEFSDYQRQAQAMAPEQALRLWVHGKIFWRSVVADALGGAIGEENESRLKRLVYRHTPLPGDLFDLLGALFASRE